MKTIIALIISITLLAGYVAGTSGAELIADHNNTTQAILAQL